MRSYSGAYPLVALLLALPVGPGCRDGSESTQPAEVRRSALSTCDRELTISFPAGVGRDSVVLGSTASLAIRDGVLLNAPAAGSARASNLGAATVEVGADARVGDLVSVGSVVLRDRVRVEGGVRTTGTVTRGSGVVVTGTVEEGAILTPPETTTWSICFPAVTNGDVNLEPDTSRTLPPGSYGALNVKSRAQLSLSSGTYTFRSITIEPQARLRLDKVNGPIALYASDALIFRGSLVDAGGNPDDFFVGFTGNGTTFLGGVFRGALVAPAGRIVLTTVPEGHTGTFFAREIEAQARVTINHRPFPSWETITGLPGSRDPGGPSPSRILAGRVLHNPPPLTSPGHVPAFIDWASFSTVDEREDARAVIQAASGRDDIAMAIAQHFRSVEVRDHGRALVSLAILGEMRNAAGEGFLAGYIHEPLPTPDPDGSTIGGEGENALVTAKATLQAKAVTGLAYRATTGSLNQVLWAVASHPSRIVRAEAISAFLAFYPRPHHHAPTARSILFGVVRPEERAFIDRVRRVRGESAATFNSKLATFIQRHPELIPPAPLRTPMPPPPPPPPKPPRAVPIF